MHFIPETGFYVTHWNRKSEGLHDCFFLTRNYFINLERILPQKFFRESGKLENKVHQAKCDVYKV